METFWCRLTQIHLEKAIKTVRETSVRFANFKNCKNLCLEKGNAAVKQTALNNTCNTLYLTIYPSVIIFASAVKLLHFHTTTVGNCNDKSMINYQHLKKT